VVISIIYLLMTIPKYLRYKREKKKEKYEKYEDLFEGLKSNNSAALAYAVFFIMRRSLMVLTLTTLPSFQFTQIMAHIYSTQFIIMYTTWVRPFDDD